MKTLRKLIRTVALITLIVFAYLAGMSYAIDRVAAVAGYQAGVIDSRPEFAL